jgi:hypothetical protein
MRPTITAFTLTAGVTLTEGPLPAWGLVLQPARRTPNSAPNNGMLRVMLPTSRTFHFGEQPTYRNDELIVFSPRFLRF